jgi:hypothetical protein
MLHMSFRRTVTMMVDKLLALHSKHREAEDEDHPMH